MATVINYLVLDERALIPLIDACNNIEATTSDNVTSKLYPPVKKLADSTWTRSI